MLESFLPHYPFIGQILILLRPTFPNTQTGFTMPNQMQTPTQRQPGFEFRMGKDEQRLPEFPPAPTYQNPLMKTEEKFSNDFGGYPHPMAARFDDQRPPGEEQKFPNEFYPNPIPSRLEERNNQGLQVPVLNQENQGMNLPKGERDVTMSEFQNTGRAFNEEQYQQTENSQQNPLSQFTGLPNGNTGGGHNTDQIPQPFLPGPVPAPELSNNS